MCTINGMTFRASPCISTCNAQYHVFNNYHSAAYIHEKNNDKSSLTNKNRTQKQRKKQTNKAEVQEEKNTGCLQMNGAVSKVNNKFISHLTGAKRTQLAAATVQVSHALPAVRSLVLTAGLRGQFPRWRSSRKRLSVCSVLRFP